MFINSGTGNSNICNVEKVLLLVENEECMVETPVLQ